MAESPETREPVAEQIAHANVWVRVRLVVTKTGLSFAAMVLSIVGLFASLHDIFPTLQAFYERIAQWFGNLFAAHAQVASESTQPSLGPLTMGNLQLATAAVAWLAVILTLIVALAILLFSKNDKRITFSMDLLKFLGGFFFARIAGLGGG